MLKLPMGSQGKGSGVTSQEEEAHSPPWGLQGSAGSAGRGVPHVPAEQLGAGPRVSPDLLQLAARQAWP